MESKQLMREGKETGSELAERKVASSRGLCRRHLIIFFYKHGGAIINADELSRLQITDNGVPLTLGITRLPEELKTKSSLCGIRKPTL